MTSRKLKTFLSTGLLISMLFFLPSMAAAAQQTVTLTPVSSAQLLGGEDFSLTATYDADSAEKTGIGLRIHYNSSVLTWNGFSDVLALNRTALGTSAQTDSTDKDGDSSTDKFVIVSWADTGSTWPGSVPLTLFKINFSPTGKGTSPVNVTFTSTYQFQPAEAVNASVTVSSVPSQIQITSSALSQTAGTKGDMAIVLKDAEDDTAAATTDVVIDLTSDSAKGTFYNAAGDTVITSVTIPTGSTSAEFKYADETVGTPTVAVSATGFTGATQQQTINAGPLAVLTVAPDTVALTADQTQLFTVTGADAYGNEVTEIGTITWSGGAGIGTIDSATGEFEANFVGDGTVTATSSIDNISDSSGTITVSAGVLAVLTVSPDTANLTTDDTQQFTVAGADANGNEVTDLGTITWSGGAGIGTIDGASGLFDATTVGTGTVTATSSINGISDTTGDVVVAVGALATLTVSPDTADLTADDTQQFTLAGADADGNPITALTPATWSVAGTIGSIDASGLFDATTVGTGIVTATIGAVSDDSGSINVSPGAPAEIVLVCDKTKVASAGKGTAVLTATFKDGDGNTVTGDSGTAVTFTASGDGAVHLYPNPGTGDTSSGVATLTLNTTGTVASGSAAASIVATAGGMTSNDVSLTVVNFSIDVAGNQTDLIRKPFAPNSVGLTGQGGTSGQYRWTITGVGSFSATETVTSVVADSVTFYAPETLTGASQAATIRLEDTLDSNLNDQVVLTVHNPTKLAFTNAALNLAAGETGTMTVEVQADDGTPVTIGAFTVALTTDSTGKFYSTNPGTEITSVTIADGASSASFNYKDEKAGTPKVTVTTEGLSSDEQIQTVVAAAANKMTLEASKTVLASDGKGSAGLTAKIFDAFDNLVTADSATQVTFTVTPDTYLTLTGSPATAAEGVAQATVTTKAGEVPSPPAAAQVSISADGLTAPASLTLTIVNFDIQVTGETTLLVSGNTPDSVVLTGTGGTAGNYRWSVSGVGSLSATNTDSVTFSAPETIEGSSQTATVTLTDATDSSLVATVTITVYNKVAITDKPTTPPVIEAGEQSATFSVGGGDDTLYTWTLTDSSGGVVDTKTGASYSFVAPSTGAFAGVYTVSVADNTGFTDSFEVKVPFKLDPAIKAFTETKLDGTPNPQAFTVLGADSDYTWEILHSETATSEVASPGDYGTWDKASPVTGDATNSLNPANVDAVKRFFIRVTVQNDDDLTEDNGLNQRIFGPFTLIPVADFALTVADEAGTVIAGAEVSVDYTDPSTGTKVAAKVTDAEGMAVFVLPDAGGTYTYMGKADGYVSGTVASKAKAASLALKAAGTDQIAGTVTDGTAGLENATITAYQPADLSKTYSANSAADGTYTITLPVGAAQSGWTVVAVLNGYTSSAMTDQAIGTVDFTLEVSTDPDIIDPFAPGSLTFNQNGQTVVVDVPVGGASQSAFIIVNQFSKTDSGASATAGSPTYVYEVRLDSTTGTLTSDQINRVEITLPIDLSVVSPGDLENGNFLIYKADSQTDLLDPDKRSIMPTSSIISTDYIGDGKIGSVTFWVDSLSVFGIGEPEGSGPAAGGGGGGGCFIDTAAKGSPTNGVGALPVVGAGLMLLGLGIAHIRRKR